MMGIIIMATRGDPLEPRATLLLLMMVRAVDTAPDSEAVADPAGRAAGTETEENGGEAAETTTTTTTTTVERETVSRSSSRDGAA